MRKENVENFWIRVNKKDKDECWEWSASKDKCNYGRLGGRLAHRISYEIHFGKIPEGQVVCHICDNPPCVNPNHLFLGTQLDNIKDMHSKNRHAHGETSYSVYSEETIKNVLMDFKSGLNMKDISKKYDMDYKYVHLVCQRRAWKHIEVDEYKYKRDVSNTNTAKLNEDKVKEIRRLSEEGVSNKELSEMFRVSVRSISRVIRNETWVNIK